MKEIKNSKQAKVYGYEIQNKPGAIKAVKIIIEHLQKEFDRMKKGTDETNRKRFQIALKIQLFHEVLDIAEKKFILFKGG